ncbi:hypothetical protein [Micromonospora cremea]|uniref:hypothetical protein n=1 Tax=Micromonospora cremea TaxID=709881 RepID=UPI00117CEC85|nr:hypothetical protein [Micromonospora cremea]
MLVERSPLVMLIRQHIVERSLITSLLRERHQLLLQLTRTVEQIIINGDRHGPFLPRRGIRGEPRQDNGVRHERRAQPPTDTSQDPFFEHRDQFAVALLLRVLSIGASTYYAWVKQAEQPCDRDVVDLA